jgi:hypothetical protein
MQKPDNQMIIRLFGTQSRSRTGMPVKAMVFETIASTNSAIWAFAFAKVVIFALNENLNL